MSMLILAVACGAQEGTWDEPAPGARSMTEWVDLDVPQLQAGGAGFASRDEAIAAVVRLAEGLIGPGGPIDVIVADETGASAEILLRQVSPLGETIKATDLLVDIRQDRGRWDAVRIRFRTHCVQVEPTVDCQ